MRISRQWQDLEIHRWFGFAHDVEKTPLDGDLAEFCPACPQPGINLPANWQTHPDQLVIFSVFHDTKYLSNVLYRWRFMRSLVVDGNFKADHLIMKNPNDDVRLMDGEGYFVNQMPYQHHLNTAHVIKQASVFDYF